MGRESVTIARSRATGMNGVKQNRITRRAPTVGDLRVAAKQGNSDAEAQDIFLFALLAKCSSAGIERLSVKDDRRIQEGYFRLIADDDDGGTETTRQEVGA
ncbi:MAG: phage tail assembly protein [Candidatus Accumulibacter sp.]|nr:phage tail assembly protein [Accumulibacter sp.]